MDVLSCDLANEEGYEFEGSSFGMEMRSEFFWDRATGGLRRHITIILLEVSKESTEKDMKIAERVISKEGMRAERKDYLHKLYMSNLKKECQDRVLYISFCREE